MQAFDFYEGLTSLSQVVSVLLADSVNPVKQALMEKSVTQLAVFFGKAKGKASLEYRNLRREPCFN